MELMWRQTLDLGINSTHGQPVSCRARPMNVDDGLDHIRWIRGLGVERLPVASYILLPNREKGLFVCNRRKISSLCRLFSTHRPRTSVFVSKAWPAPTSYYRPCGEHFVTRGWVRAPNEGPPFVIHDAVAGFVDRCLSKTYNLAF